ncbi:class I SAM-dependent methyltransferase [Novosphingobium album (ex Liu et al. 2023)]|uniref:Methyltransferase domain-containing protein n=1 Tax=Novosphingobium album (ex Liu et al. 2023) TaxID=3031130 RepID=A0ABT5WW97_9SPHN|nr:methyltransferase domain-containing protein [Novosphingobium album (ex Liu et al. 2023)]MDE8654137.1 methyltransferase domain-containing protein [Novosphingobium album (ex Liu et al. 2023)]
MSEGYVHDTYGRYLSGSGRSARIVAATLAPLLAPASVLDVGCGAGVWLEAFRAQGASAVHGIDGPWAPADRTLAPGEFTAWNFEERGAEGLILPRDRYDLVISLEFVEHLSAGRADAIAAFLAAKGDALLISAAIPLQGGQHHVNERWPEYWTRKLAGHGFRPFDALRLALWDEPEVQSWYRQNMLLYFREGTMPEAVRAWGEALALQALNAPRALVHPEFYARRFGRLHHALTNPLGFARMLLAERRGGVRGIPPIPHLARE